MNNNLCRSLQNRILPLEHDAGLLLLESNYQLPQILSTYLRKCQWNIHSEILCIIEYHASSFLGIIFKQLFRDCNLQLES